MHERIPNDVTFYTEFEKWMEEVRLKKEKTGSLSLNFYDHQKMRSGRHDWPKGKEGLAEYEIMSDEEISNWLDGMIASIETTNKDKETTPADMDRESKHDVMVTIDLLRKVSRLPDKFLDFKFSDQELH
jgi:hypothetical protein